MIAIEHRVPQVCVSWRAILDSVVLLLLNIAGVTGMNIWLMAAFDRLDVFGNASFFLLIGFVSCILTIFEIIKLQVFIKYVSHYGR